jgi:hypothetical protein
VCPPPLSLVSIITDVQLRSQAPRPGLAGWMGPSTFLPFLSAYAYTHWGRMDEFFCVKEVVAQSESTFTS